MAKKQRVTISLQTLFTLSPDKAVKYLESMGYKITWNWREQLKAIQQHAFTVAKVTKADVLIAIKDALVKALDEGMTYNDWKKQIDVVLQQKGYQQRDDGSAWRKDTIFRTNLQSAYQAGRYEEMKNAKSAPYWQYVAVMDVRTRPSHAELNGKVFRADDPFWKTHYPPNGYNCRCRVRALTEEQVQSMGLQVSSGSDFKNINPDPGFETNPADWWQPDLRNYPKELRGELK